MKRPIQAYRSAWAFAVCLAFLSAFTGCARSRFSFLDVYRDENVQVRLVEWKDESGNTIPRGFDHPWQVDAQTLEGLLTSIQYRRGVLIQRNKVRDVFPEDVLKVLLDPLRKAFEQASPDQAVDVSFLRRETTLAVFQREYLTDGLLFHKEGAFHCALRNLAFETVGGPEGGDNPYTGDPTEKPLRTDWTFVLKEGQSLARSASSGLFVKEEFPNWIVLDLARSVAGAETARPEKAETVAEPGATGAQGAAASEAFKVPSVSREKSTLQGGGAPQPLTVLPPEAEERLRFLEELRREGALSEEAYKKKKRELMERGARESAPIVP